MVDTSYRSIGQMPSSIFTCASGAFPTDVDGRSNRSPIEGGVTRDAGSNVIPHPHSGCSPIRCRNSVSQLCTPARKSSNGVQSPRLFSRMVVLWFFLTFYLVQSQSSVFAIHSATRHNVFRRSNLASSNPVACLARRTPAGKFFGRFVDFQFAHSAIW